MFPFTYDMILVFIADMNLDSAMLGWFDKKYAHISSPSKSLGTHLNQAFPLDVLGTTAINTVDRSPCGVARTLRNFKIANLSLVPHILASVDDSIIFLQ